MYKIAIIDDDTTRQKLYEELFKDHFEIVKFLSSPDEINAAQDVEVHAYIMDLIYDGPEYEGIIWDDVISSINEKKRVPIILVSQKWQEFSSPNTIGRLCRFDNIVECLGFDMITKENIAIPLQLKKKIDKFYRYTDASKEKNEKVTILHLSDLQFGDKATDPSSFLSAYDIPGCLKDYGIEPDIIVISGDIATYGKAEEYKEAYEWLSEFTSQLWGDNSLWNQRVVIVPGNHDVDESVYLPNVYEWDYEKKDFDKTHPIKKRENVVDTYDKLSLLNYRYFMHQVTGDSKYLDKDTNLFFVNERFLNWGIRFYEINTAKDISPLDRRKICIDSKDFETLKKNTLNFSGNKIFNIAVSHFGTSILDTEGKSAEWSRMKSFFETSKVNLLMSGHVHKNSIKCLGNDDEGSYFCEHMTLSTAGTVSLAPSARPNDEPRGFNVIELERKDGIVTNLFGRVFTFKGPSIEPGRTYSCNDAVDSHIKYNRKPL